MTPVTIVEIDLPVCSLTYGVSPCTASIGVTGTRKCFNTLRTCQDRANFTTSTKTVRFCAPTHDVTFTSGGLPVTVIPSLTSVNTTPAVVNPGVDIGTRESVRIAFEDHPHSDAGFDKYLADRNYDPFKQGTLWGKLRARYPSFEGYALRVLRGEAGQDLADMRTYHYVIDSYTPAPGVASVVAKDVLILTDKKKAQAPLLSEGVLAADITAGTMSFNLSPSGIGNAQYPASGKVAIGGKEVISYTRSGDAITVVARGLHGTEAQEHDEDDRVQVVLDIPPSTVSSIFNLLLTTFTPGIDPAWINLTAWEQEVDDYIDRLYEAVIAEPTAVVDLLNELIEQAGLIFWWDPEEQQIQLRSLRPATATSETLTDDVIVAGSFKPKEQPQRRISQMWTYFGQRNPLEKQDEQTNYRATVATIDDEASQDYLQPAIKKVFSRWINVNNRAAASRLNSMQLARYRDAPRRFSFALHLSHEEPRLGATLQLQTWALQDDTGAEIPVPAQLVSVDIKEDGYMTEAQESIYVPQDDLETTHLIYIDVDSFNINLRTIHDTLYASLEDTDIVRCIVSPGVTIGSNSTSLPAFDVGGWPAAVTPEIIVNGRIQGRGGTGAGWSGGTLNGGAGGTALYTRHAISMTNNGLIYGGGGGGGRGVNNSGLPAPNQSGAGGGGGAGTVGGTGGQFFGQNGTADAGGLGGSFSGPGGLSVGGPGGGPGAAGAAGGGLSTGGAAGNGVDGESYITYVNVGTILGPRVN